MPFYLTSIVHLDMEFKRSSENCCCSFCVAPIHLQKINCLIVKKSALVHPIACNLLLAGVLLVTFTGDAQQAATMKSLF